MSIINTQILQIINITNTSQLEDHSQGRNPSKGEYPTEGTTLLPIIVPLAGFAGSMVLEGMPPASPPPPRRDFTVSHRNATLRMGTAKL